jgi:hypothetical protein
VGVCVPTPASTKSPAMTNTYSSSDILRMTNVKHDSSFHILMPERLYVYIPNNIPIQEKIERVKLYKLWNLECNCSTIIPNQKTISVAKHIILHKLVVRLNTFRCNLITNIKKNISIIDIQYCYYITSIYAHMLRNWCISVMA